MLKKIIKLRKEFHKNAEESLKEYKTQRMIINFVREFGIKNENIKVCGDTGLIIKLYGKSNKTKNTKNIMIRAEMDALPMKEKNDLEYKSITNFSHLCGHDGHMAILIYSIYLTYKNLNKFPKNCSVSFLFQPGEEGYGGAKKQINDGCLKDIDEIYGLHNMPFGESGDIFLKEGIMMSACFKYEISFMKNRNNLNKYNLNETLLSSNEFIILLEKYLKKLKNKNEIIISFPKIDYNNEKTIISGFLRGFDNNLIKQVNNKINDLIKFIEKKYNLKIIINKETLSEFPVNNDENLTYETINILNKKFNKVRKDNIPVLASEDFSDFQRIIPGVFLFWGIGNKNNVSLHNEQYIFNDLVIEKGSNIWMEIILNRLNL